MHILAIILGVTLGIVLFLSIIALIIYGKIKLTMKKIGFKANSFSDIAEEVEKIREEDSTRARSISGMTSLLLPNIRYTYPIHNELENDNNKYVTGRLLSVLLLPPRDLKI